MSRKAAGQTPMVPSQGLRAIGLARRNRAGLLRGTALSAAALLVLAPVALAPAALAQPAPNARPTGGVVVAGNAAISQSASATTIDQSSARAAVNWQSFNVGAQQSVVFNQPGANAVTLNRVVGGDPSAIAGHIRATGSIVLVNPSGVVFSHGAQVDAQGVIVSAAGITNRNFMDGRMVFDQPAHAGAAVVNQGTITVGQAGLAALVAPQVANSGVINARLGHVVLAGAEAATLDMYGDGLLSIDVTKQVTTLPGKNGHTALVTNTGMVLADGGTVQITAAAADGVVQTLVRAGGTIRASSIGAQGGTVVIAGTGGDVVVDGRIVTAGRKDGEQGGSIGIATTGSVVLEKTARLDASGSAGGGTVAVGTRSGAAVVMKPGARIAADATKSGKGGTVALLAGGTTEFQGSITARGGTPGGNGGAVEISGGLLKLGGSVDVSARAGGWHTGSILLDPTDVVITATGTFDAGSDAGTSSVTVAQLSLLTGDLTIQADHNLTVATGATITNLNSLATSLALEAGQGVAGTGALTINGAVSIAVPLMLVGGTDGIALNGNVSASTVALATAGAVTQGAAGISTGTLTANVASAALTGANTITTLGSIASPLGFTLVNSADLSVNGAVGVNSGMLNLVAASHAISGAGQITATFFAATADSVSLTGPNAIATIRSSSAPHGFTLNGTGDLTVFGSLDVSAGTLALTSGGSVNESGFSTINALAFTGSGSTIALLGTNSIGTLANVSAPQGFTLANTSALALSGSLAAAGGTVSLSVAGALTQDSAGTLSAGLLTGSATSVALSGANQVAALGSFTATSGNFQLSNAGSLTVAGGVGVPGGATLALAADSIGFGAGGSLTATGGVVALSPYTASAAITLDGSTGFAGSLPVSAGTLLLGSSGMSGDIVIAGPIDLTGKAATLQVQTTGRVDDSSGGLHVGTLGGSAGSATLTGGNTIATLASFSATAGDFTLRDTTPLAVAGTVSVPGGHVLTLVDDGIGFTGAGHLSAAGAKVVLAPLTATAPVLVDGVNGFGGALAVTAATLQIGSSGLSSNILLDGPLDLTTRAPVIELVTTGSVTNGGGALHIGTLAGSAAGVTLSGASMLDALAGLAVTNGFTLHDSSNLSVQGTLAAGASTVSLDIGTSATLSETAAGAIQAATLTATASSIDLSQGANVIGALANVSAVNGLSLNNTTVPTLTLTGSIDVHAGMLNLMAPAQSVIESAAHVAALALAGSLGTLTLNDAGSVNTIGTLGTLSAPGGIFLTDAAPTLTIAGLVSAGTLGMVNLQQTSGDITESTGSIQAGTLVATASGTLDLNAVVNDIATLSGIYGGTGVLIRDTPSGGTLTQEGLLISPAIVSVQVFSPIPVAPAVAVPADLLLNGSIQAASLNLTASGSILQDMTASALNRILAGDITLQAGGAVRLGQAVNQVSTLQPSSAGGDFLLADSLPLTVAGATQAGTLGAGHVLTLQDDVLDFGPTASLSVSGGTLALAPLAAGDTLQVNGSLVAVAELAVLGADATGTALVASGLTLLATLDFSQVGTLGLYSTGAVSQAGGTLLLPNGTLVGNAQDITLDTPANTVGTLGDIVLGIGGSLTLSDGQDLLVAGAIRALDGTTELRTGSIVLSLGTFFLTETSETGRLDTETLTVTAGSISLPGSNDIGTLLNVVGPAGITISNAADLLIAGTLDAHLGTLDLRATGHTITEDVATISAQTLAGTMDSLLLNDGDSTNDIAALGDLAATDRLLLTVANGSVSNGNLLLAGSVSGAQVSLVVPNTLTLAGTLAQTALEIGGSATPGLVLDAGSILQTGGTIDAQLPSGTLTLLSSGDIIQNGGGIAALTLTGSAAGAVSLAMDGNDIGTLADFSSQNGFTLHDTPSSGALVQTGSLSDDTSINLHVLNGGLTLSGSLFAFDMQGVPTIDLGADGSIVQQGGSILAATLALNAGANVDLGSTGNAIDVLNASTAGGSFLLADSAPLALHGMVQAGEENSLILRADSITFQEGSQLSVPFGRAVLTPLFAGDAQTVSGGGASPLIIASSVVIGGDAGGETHVSSSLSLPALLDLPNIGSLTLYSTGAVSQAGGTLLLPDGTLAGIASAITLASASNTVSALGDVTVSQGFTLADAQTLTLTGRIGGPSGGTGTVDLELPGFALTESDAAAVLATQLTATASSIGLPGANSIGTLANVVGPGGIAINNATDLRITGALDAHAGTLALLAAGSTISEQSAAITAQTLDATASSLLLNDPASSNVIATLGSVTAADQLLVNAGDSNGNLRLAGSVSGAQVALKVPGALTLAGALQAGTLALAVGGGVVQSGGTISASLVTGSAASLSLPDANAIAALGDLSAGGSLMLATVGDLSINGAVSAGGGMTLVTPGALTEAGGNITTPSFSGSAGAVSFTAANQIGALGSFTSQGAFLLADAGALTVQGPLTAASAALSTQAGLTLAGAISTPTLALAAAGDITQTGGAITAALLTGSAADIRLGQANNIGTLGALSAGGTLVVNDAAPLQLAGDISAASAVLTSAGSIVQTSGTFTAGTLGGSAVGLAQFGPDDPAPVALIGTLGPFTVSNGTLVLTNAQPLTLQLPITADMLAITAPGSIILGPGTLATTGTPVAIQAAGPQPANPGSYIYVLASGGNGGVFTQQGATSVVPLSGGVATLRIQTQGNGTITLAGLTAPQVELILDAETGHSTGTLDVGGLTVLGGGGGADLSGLVNGFGGKVAARVSFIAPTANKSYQINACPLQSVNCLVLSVQAVPLASLLSEVVVRTLQGDRDDPELLLPNISSEDY